MPEQLKGKRMKLEVGKWYKTRGGQKAYVGLQIPNPELAWDEFSGYFERQDGCEPCTWAASGAFNEDTDSILDLVSEWREPRSITVDVYLCELEGQLHAACNDPRLVFRTYGNIIGVKRGITINEGDGMEENSDA